MAPGNFTWPVWGQYKGEKWHVSNWGELWEQEQTDNAVRMVIIKEQRPVFLPHVASCDLL